MATILNTARTSLELSGYRVIACADAREALAAIEVEAVDLLLTDVVMPGMNGRELALRVTERRPEVAVLYTSGYAADMLVRADVAEEAVAFLPKPYSADVLAHKIREVLDARRLPVRQG